MIYQILSLVFQLRDGLIDEIEDLESQPKNSIYTNIRLDLLKSRGQYLDQVIELMQGYRDTFKINKTRKETL